MKHLVHSALAFQAISVVALIGHLGETAAWVIVFVMASVGQLLLTFIDNEHLAEAKAQEDRFKKIEDKLAEVVTIQGFRG